MAAGVLTTLTSLAVRKPAWVLTYAGRNITADISGMITEISYSDSTGAQTRGRGRRLEHETDELEVTLEDRDRRWQGPWFPQRGDVLSAQIGYDGQTFLDAGNFQIEELELKGPPDTFYLKCISTGITPSLRTCRSFAYENATLMDIAHTVAQRNGLTVTGLSHQDNNIEWTRITQHNETDVHFLRRLALKHGYDFTVRGTQLIFYSRTALEQIAPVAVVLRTQTKTFEFRTKTQAIYQDATVIYQNPQQKQLVQALASAGFSAKQQKTLLQSLTPSNTPSITPTGDHLYIVERLENPQQAALKAQSAIHDANMLEVTGLLELEGTPLLVAGINIMVQGFKHFDGKYHISASKHRLDRSTGYTTEIEIRQL